MKPGNGKAPSKSRFVMTGKQKVAWEAIGGNVRHNLLYGGARSGKTFLIVFAIVCRALAHKSRHAIMRHAFNHVKNSVIFDTLPKVMETCFPDLVPHCTLNKSDWIYTLPARDGGTSEIVFSGLDDKERTERILGLEFSSIYLNEASQIALSARNMAATRLAQRTPLALKMYYDANPPSRGHWLHKMFIEKIDPESKQPLPNPASYQAVKLNPQDNVENLGEGFLEELAALPSRERRRFLDGEWGIENESPLWSPELLDQCRRLDAPSEYSQIVIGVDPSGCSGPADKRSDEIGIVVTGLGRDQKGYVLEDLSGRYGPREWGKVVADAYDRLGADAVVAETNFGGALVREILQVAKPGIPVREVKASRGKAVRATPVAALFETGKVKLAGRFSALEDQMLAMSPAGYTGDRSPDRLDAMVWALAALFPALARQDSEYRHRPTHAEDYNPMTFYDRPQPGQPEGYDPFSHGDERRPR
ncbi:phage terminase large subunit [Aestuariivirga sp.]|uniref:phage terminase large subunit n=1 Tax=Aestuariivirga sp. TaxID=2650926 RepID=UPI00359417CB